ncbi:putative GPI mannosyltransferase 4 [Apostichopus japonicus]|uniref:Mannosyltransferase n=1 Tax=Stichopus japonicus TaxID=307972 RepID=A0A2G8KG73_STIJA|nr:putative GPI mannosyltransferase 4 [Apostichopus japonicus]
MVVDSRQKQLVPQAQSKKEKGKPPETEKPKGKGKSQGKGKGQGKTKGQNKTKETGTKHSKQETSRQNLKNISAGFWLGVFLLEGFFNRPTIGLYALFPMLFWLTGNATSFGLSSLLTVVGNGLLILPGVLAHLLVHLVLDSLYAGTLDVRFFTDIDFFSDNLNLDLWQNITLTPLNFIKYNLDVDNLSSHGIHPQVTHFFVNLPMLCLPLYVSFFTEVFAVYFGKGKASRPTFTSSTSRAFWDSASSRQCS